MNRLMFVFVAALVVPTAALGSQEGYHALPGLSDDASLEPFDSLDVQFVGNWPYGPSYAAAYDSARGLVFCGSGGGVYVLDVSNPSLPTKVSESIRTRGFVIDLQYDHDSQTLLVADHSAGLEIWDVTNAATPTRSGSHITPFRAYGVARMDSFACVADADSGLRVIDVADPSNPYEIGYYIASGNARGVAARDSLAFMASGPAGLRVIDLS